jgi:hypothetical protein
MKVYFDRPSAEEIPDLAILLEPGVNEVSDEHGKILLKRKQVKHVPEEEERAPARRKKDQE